MCTTFILYLVLPLLQRCQVGARKHGKLFPCFSICRALAIAWLFAGYYPSSETEHKVKRCGSNCFIPVWSSQDVQIWPSVSYGGKRRRRCPLTRHLLGDGARVGWSYLPQSWVLANSLVLGFDSLTSGLNEGDWTMSCTTPTFLWEGVLKTKSWAGLDKKRGDTKKIMQRLTCGQPTLWWWNLCWKSGV